MSQGLVGAALGIESREPRVAREACEAQTRDAFRYMWCIAAGVEIAAGAGEEEVIQAIRNHPEAPTPSFLKAK